MTGPSISGSLYGIPISNPSAPASAIASKSATDVSGSGSPAVRYGSSAARRSDRTSANSSSSCWEPESVIQRRHLHHVLVSSPGEQNGHGLADQRGGLPHNPRDGVRGFEGGDDAFGPRQKVECCNSLVVGHRLIAHDSGIPIGGVLGTDARVVESGTDRMRLEDLTLFVLQEVGERAVDHSRGTPT